MRLKPTPIFTALALAALAISAPRAQGGGNSIMVNGTQRTYLVHAPQGIPANAPLVFSIHGLNQTNTWMRQASGFDRIADRDKFVVVYPQALNNASNQPSWNLGGDTELNFITALIDTMAARHQIDRNRVYSTGFSMGGMLSYYLTCNASDKIAAIAPVGGYLLGGTGACNTQRSMPIHHIHGAADDFVKYENLHAYLNNFADKFGCNSEPTEVDPYPDGNPTQKVTMESWGPCEGGSELNLVSIAGLGHAYTTGPDLQTTEAAWAFLKKYSLEDDVSVRPGVRAAAAPGLKAKLTGAGLEVASGIPLSTLTIYDSFGRRLAVWKQPAGAPEVMIWQRAVPWIRGGVYWIRGEGSHGEVTSRMLLP